MSINIEFTGCQPAHVQALRDALELYMRCALGQFSEVVRTHDHRVGMSRYDKEVEVNKAIRAILLPDMPPNASYGIGSPMVSVQAKVCYELWKLLGGGTPGEPLNYSGVPAPKVRKKAE